MIEAAISVELIMLPTLAFTKVIIPEIGEITCFFLIWASYTAVSVWRGVAFIACSSFSACKTAALSDTILSFEDKILVSAVLIFVLWVSRAVLSVVDTLA